MTARISLRPVLWLVSVAALVLVGCASPRHRAPVEQRGGAPLPIVTETASGDAVVPVPPPVLAKPVEEPVKTYVVKSGDTLIRIGLETGQNWRDIARWNGLENANVIEVGQTLRVSGTPAELATTPRPAPAAPSGDGKAAAPVVAAAPAAAPAPALPQALPPVREADESISWLWPASGPVLAGFDEARNKGLAIGGKAGEPVLASADGRVVYAGSGLRGYGNLVIVKHNNTYLTAYAHNQALLVKEDQVVRRGQRIAEMGSTEADRVQLHFEIRRQGKPVDPARLLPAR